jgi:hypothetical protein
VNIRDTSLEAFNRVVSSGRFSAKLKKAFEFIWFNPGNTSLEMFERLRQRPSERDSYQPCVTHLVQMGVVVEGPKRMQKNGYMAHPLYATGQLAVPLVKQKHYKTGLSQPEALTALQDLQRYEFWINSTNEIVYPRMTPALRKMMTILAHVSQCGKCGGKA